jgi:hypothetical protein
LPHKHCIIHVLLCGAGALRLRAESPRELGANFCVLDFCAARKYPEELNR